MKLQVQQKRFTHKKEQVELDMEVEKHQYLLAAEKLTGQRAIYTKTEN